MDIREFDLWKSQTDSIIITNFDKNNKEINKVIINTNQIIPVDDSIPNEDFNEKASSYVLPDKQIWMRTLSISRPEATQRGRQAGHSWGPKLNFENRIEWKSRSRSKRAIIPNNWRSNKFARESEIASETYKIQGKHQPKILANQCANQTNPLASKIKIQKPPLWNSQINPININKVNYSSRVPVEQWKRTSSYQSLVVASEKLK